MRSRPASRCTLIAAVAMLAACAMPMPRQADLLIVNARLLQASDPAPDPVAIAVRDGRIVAVGAHLRYEATRRINARGRIVTAGFWNTHVHLDPTSRAPDHQRALERHWLRYGFVYLVDLGSTPALTQSLIADIAAGRLAGPQIFRAGGSFVATDGTPSYLPGLQLPELDNATQASEAVAAVLASGADGIKIFSGSFQSPTETRHLDADVIAAVTASAHAANAFVVAHPTDAVGVRRALDNGVDILAHTAPAAGPWSPDDVATMVERDVALIPTLYLFEWQLRANGLPETVIERFAATARSQLAAFRAGGGDVLFGTDAGFVTDYNPAAEYRAMAAAGLSFDDILASLTQSPAMRFGVGSGRVARGEPASLVILNGDPREDIAALADVHTVVRAGRVVFSGRN